MDKESRSRNPLSVKCKNKITSLHYTERLTTMHACMSEESGDL